MKKAVVFTTLFLATFALSYLACCYLIPGFRIKLAADPWAYFLASIRHMALIKTLISLTLGLMVGGIFTTVSKAAK